MKKTEFSIQNYSAFAVCFLLVHEEAAAEAVYTDIPDTLINYNNETFDIDLNDDEIIDFAVIRRSFSFLETTYYSGYITSHLSALSAGPQAVGNKIAGFTEVWGGSSAAGSFLVYFPYALDAGEMIDDILSFQDDGFQILAFRYRGQYSSYVKHGGDWYPESNDHHLGVYFKDSEDCYHYGWIRCDVKNDGKELVIKDFAYETKCGIGILAGDLIGDTTTVGINELDKLNATVYSFENTVYITVEELPQGLQIYIYDLAGRLIYSDPMKDRFFSIKLNQPTGHYIINLSSDNKKYSRKIFID